MIDDDYNWFLDNYKKLFNEYGNCYIAIKDKHVIGKYDSYAEGIREIQKSEQLGTFIVQRCGEDESAYTNYISSVIFIPVK